MDTLFYDGQCPLCRKEIRLLRTLADTHLRLQDLHCAELSPAQKDAMLRTLHLKRGEGEHWLTGVDATVAAWQHTAWGWLFAPLNWPVVRWVSHRAYAVWADRRYRQRYHCKQCATNIR